jgi:magnesium transporter
MKRGQKTFPSVATNAMEWVLVNRNQPEQMAELRARYRYHPMDLKEVQPPVQRAKALSREGYIFLILLFPQYDEAENDIRVTEVDFFISHKRLVTVNVDGYGPLLRLFHTCQHARSAHVCMQGDVMQLMHVLLRDMLDDVSPMLVRMGADLDRIEEQLFTNVNQQLIQELLRVKTNIANIRRVMQPQQAVLRNLMKMASAHFPNDPHAAEHLEGLAEYAQDLWDALESQKVLVDTLHETHKSLIDHRINDIIKTLTIFSVVILPITAIAGIFGMNAVNMPVVTHGNGFWMIVAFMIALSGGMIAYFKWRRWL